MGRAQQVAKAFAELTPRERRKAIEMVPELLAIDERFILARRSAARRDLLARRVVPVNAAIARAEARRKKR